MKLHLRLAGIDVPGKTATIALDEFYPIGERTHALWMFQRNPDGTLDFSVRAPAPESEVLESGQTISVSAALYVLERATERVFGATIANPIQFAPDGLDTMGLWTALG